MPIPESQLDTWSHQGSTTNSSTTYQTIKNVLEAPGTAFAGHRFEVFLQGSYGNDTNIRTESDVDIVIRLDETFGYDLTSLPMGDQAAWQAAYPGVANYGHAEFKRDVLGTLTNQYANEAQVGTKAITISSRGNRRKADVIVTITYRRYTSFQNLSNQSFESGVCFWNSAGQRVANYPKLHSSNLTSRHQASGNRLKPTVRVMKNLRSEAEARGLLAAGTAPSYFIEGLLYNAPINCFTTRYDQSLVNLFTWYRSNTTKQTLVCPSGQHYLLRAGFLECWDPANADAFIEAAIALWNNW